MEWNLASTDASRSSITSPSTRTFRLGGDGTRTRTKMGCSARSACRSIGVSQHRVLGRCRRVRQLIEQSIEQLRKGWGTLDEALDLASPTRSQHETQVGWRWADGAREEFGVVLGSHEIRVLCKHIPHSIFLLYLCLLESRENLRHSSFYRWG